MRQILVFVIILGCAQLLHAKSRLPDMTEVKDELIFNDDIDFENMELAISRQIQSFKRTDLSIEFKLGTQTFKRSDLKETLESFLEIVKSTQNCFLTNTKDFCYNEFSKTLNANFKIYSPKPQSWEAGFATNQSLFTAYYSPDFHGSRVQNEIYKHPIYQMPTDLKLRSLSREQIDFDKKLANKDLEIVYVKESLYDIWLLHVEGGGRVILEEEDGSTSHFYLSYAGTNKQPFNMLYKFMLANGMLQAGQAGIDNQRNYFENHPEDQRAILASCPSYIFFKESHEEPVGVQNILLTEKRSLATDYRIYLEYGLLNFIKAKRPMRVNGKIKQVEFSRFFINQDTGGAIKGNARSDLYFGFGKEAELTANGLKTLGNQYFLIKK